jgi:hypothetical protein
LETFEDESEPEVIMRIIGITGLILAAVTTGAWAQSSGLAHDCGPAHNLGEAAKTGPGGNERPAQQPVERSAILPDASGQEASAAPTAQQHGQSVNAQTDCPKPPNRIDAPKTQ